MQKMSQTGDDSIFIYWRWVSGGGEGGDGADGWNDGQRQGELGEVGVGGRDRRSAIKRD